MSSVCDLCILCVYHLGEESGKTGVWCLVVVGTFSSIFIFFSLFPFFFFFFVFFFFYWRGARWMVVTLVLDDVDAAKFSLSYSNH